MNLTGHDLEEIMTAVDRASYSRDIQQVAQLEGVAFCRGPATFFPRHEFVFAVTTAQGTNAGIFREVHENPELTHGDYLQLLVNFIEEVPHHNLCDADVTGLCDIALCRSEAQVFHGHAFLFRLKTPSTRKANIFLIY